MKVPSLFERIRSLGESPTSTALVLLTLVLLDLATARPAETHETDRVTPVVTASTRSEAIASFTVAVGGVVCSGTVGAQVLVVRRHPRTTTPRPPHVGVTACLIPVSVLAQPIQGVAGALKAADPTYWKGSRRDWSVALSTGVWSAMTGDCHPGSRISLGTERASASRWLFAA